jgi:hypothetical protein
MTYAVHQKDFSSCLDKARTQPVAVAKKPGILRRFFRALYEPSQKEVDRQIASFLARSGGRLTDDVERELMQRLATGDWNVHRDTPTCHSRQGRSRSHDQWKAYQAF